MNFDDYKTILAVLVKISDSLAESVKLQKQSNDLYRTFCNQQSEQHEFNKESRNEHAFINHYQIREIGKILKEEDEQNDK
jgi:hypothetical protein